jgi:hypothetical protein
MSPPEERIARLEERVRVQDEWLRSIDEKVDRLLAAAAMGRGAWWAVLRVGGFAVLVVTAAAWLFDRIPLPHK